MRKINKDRANRIDAALEAYFLSDAKTDGTLQKETWISDMLTDVLHWCEREKVSFKDCERKALGKYLKEIESDYKQRGRIS